MQHARALLCLTLLIMLTACYGDMMYGVETPDEDTQEEQWWCKYRNSCEKKDADTWW